MKTARTLVVIILSCVLLPLACYSQNDNSALRKDGFDQIRSRLPGFSTASGDDDEEDQEYDEDSRHPMSDIEDSDEPSTASPQDSLLVPPRYTPNTESRSQKCGARQVQCDNGKCYPLIKRCDGVLDCTDSSDEAGCPPRQRRPPMYNENTTPYTVSRPDYDTTTTTRRWDPYDPPSYNFAPPFEDSRNLPSSSTFAPYTPTGSTTPQGRYYPLNYPTATTAATPPPTFTTRAPTSVRATTPTAATSPESTAPMVFNEVCVPKRHFQCSSGQCIPRWQKCDRVPDCHDASDEKECRSCDERLHFTCNNGQCIGKELLCDGWNDCRDKSDETHCRAVPCRPSEFRCRDGSCIPRSGRCNGRPECRDGSDEGPFCSRSPEVVVCKTGEFRCGDNSCIPDSKRCDRHRDCPAGDDERDCESDRSCAAQEFKCPDGICIRQTQLCDGFSDCVDGADELNCEKHSVAENELGLRSDDEKILKQREHERRWHQELERRRAEDARRRQQHEQQQQIERRRIEDERRRAEEARKTREHWERKERLQEEEEKRRKLEEQNRREQEATKWLESNLMEFANNLTDGPQKHGQCFPGEFPCKNREQCVAAERVCDRRMDCSDGSDEVNCCGPNEHRCGDGKCLQRGRCDGKSDCADGSDELNCPNRMNDIDVRVYPSVLNETAGHNAILRCREEGPRRLKVHWTRADGRPLKAGHTDVRGRLTLPKVDAEDAGVYLCVPTSADGEEIRAGQRSAILVVLPRVYPPQRFIRI